MVNDRGGQSHVPDFQFGLPPRGHDPKHLDACILCWKMTIEMVDAHILHSNSCTYDSGSGFGLLGSLSAELGGRLLMSVLRGEGDTYTCKL